MHCTEFSAFDFVDQPIFVLVPDADDRPVYHFMNKAGLARVNKSLDQISGQPAHQVFSGRAAYTVYRRQCDVWSNAQASEYEIALPLASGSFWVRTKVQPVCDATGTMTHMVGTSLDITAERDQLQAHTMAAASAREMEDLVCLAAHDLRSPIGNLKSLAVLMRQDFVDHGDGKAELIDMIDAISDKALSVVSDIMGQAMATSTRACRESFDLGALCDDIIVLLDPTRMHSIAYPRLQIEADCVAVHIILRNLVENALRHCGAKSAQVVIEASPMNAERLLFIVRDNGDGFDANAFSALSDMTDYKAGGFGLIGVRRLVRARGGKMTIMPPKHDSGAEVQIELPGRFTMVGNRLPEPFQIA